MKTMNQEQLMTYTRTLEEKKRKIECQIDEQWEIIRGYMGAKRRIMELEQEVLELKSEHRKAMNQLEEQGGLRG